MDQRPLRVGLIADIINAVPPAQYGGIERIVYLLVEELVGRGHEVTLFASDDSQVPCRLVPYGHRRSRSRLVEARNTLALHAQLLRRAPGLDLVHCFGRTLYLLPLLPLPIPKVQTYQCPISPQTIRRVRRVSRDTLTFTACSSSCARPTAGLGRWEVIYNAVLLRQYTPTPAVAADAPLVFLSRLDRVKGAHSAIAVARATGRRLVIAGNLAPDGENRAYFEREVRPQIDGAQIRYIGPVNDAQKNELLGGAAAMLFPIEWDEPFGIVMIEALACGTPVIAARRGAVPEVIQDGVNGFVCDSVAEMAAAVGRLPAVSRAACRATVEARFSSATVADAYERLYRRLVAGAPRAA
jgi:glycosyltransferase involved in cell wall biosynthesis